MVYDFNGIKITDDTREYKEGFLLLRTYQNSKFIQDQKTITPKELIEQFELDQVQVVGVTGTNGKTTTTAAIYSSLLDLGYKVALQGTRGFYIDDRLIAEKTHTTPPLLQTLYHLFEAKKLGCDYFVMEVSSHAIAQNRIESIDFALKVLTNITQDHLDYHKTMENYIGVKNSFFMDESNKLINKDEPKALFNPKNARTYGIENMATYKVLAYSLEEGISAVVQFGSDVIEFFAPVLGLFNLYNLTAALASVHMLTQKPLDLIAQTFENFGGVHGRMEIVSIDPLIVVDFAHTPDGMQKVFESFAGKSIVALFGAGGDRDRDKRALMGQMAAKYCTKIYLTSDNPRSEDPEVIIEDIAKGIKTDVKVEKITDRKEAIQKAIEGLSEDEVLLLLGKGDEKYIEIGEKKIPHSDIEWAKECLKKRLA